MLRKIVFLVNTTEGINVWRRAVTLRGIIHKKHPELSIKLINRKRSKGRDLIRFLRFSLANRGDAFHIFEPFPPTFPTLFALLKTLRRPIIYDSGDIHYAVSRISSQSYTRYTTLKWLESVAFRASDIVIVRGRGMGEILENLFNIDPAKLHWIPDGVDLTCFSPKGSEQAKKKLGLEDKIIIGYASDYRPLNVGSLPLCRGWELIHVSKRLLNSGYKDFLVLMVGRGRALDTLKRMAVELRVKDYVKFTGFVPDELYPTYINAMDICFYESLDDISYQAMTGAKMQEYMACGKPVVAGKIGEAKYVLRDAGILVRPLKPNKADIPRYLDDVTKAIMLLIEDGNLRKRLGNNARKRAEEHYDWNKIAEKLSQLYTSLPLRR
jgi:glycosyltransferase involved in cell wall biosynthesis